MKTRNSCKNCSALLQDGQTFCGVCGTFVDAGKENDLKVECEMHPDRRAVGLCVICSKPICSDCEVKSGQKILCSDPQHKILLEEWCLMHMPDSEYEAEALVRNLADSGIEAKSFSLHDHAGTHWLEEIRVLLFVKKSEEEKAKALLTDLNLIGNE